RQPQRYIMAIAMALGQTLRAEQVRKTVGKSLDLQQLDAGEPAMRADDGIARTDDRMGIGIDRSRAIFQFAREAVVEALEVVVACLAEIEIGKQSPQRDRGAANNRVLDLAEPPHEAGRQPARNAIREQEVDVFLEKQAAEGRSYCHETVSPYRYDSVPWIRT